MELSKPELARVENQLQDYAPAQAAVATLNRHNGNLDSALEEMLVATYGAPAQFGQPSLWEVTRDVLRQEICSDEGFRGRVQAYLADRTQASLLTAAIIYLVEQMSLPFTISPSLATLIVLYITKVGLEIFCKYTAPPDPKAP